MGVEEGIAESNFWLKAITGLMTIFLVGLAYDIYLLQKEIDAIKKSK